MYLKNRCKQQTIHLFYTTLQFIIEPKSIEKPIKLQLPIVLATYPFRNGSAGAGGAGSGDVSHTWPESILKPDTHYPSTLPIFRPWLHDKPDTS